MSAVANSADSFADQVRDTETPALRLDINRLGLWLFFASEAFLFSAVIAARFYLTGLDRPEHLNQKLALGITIVLLFSSVSAFTAESAARKGDRRGLLSALGLTIFFGLVFMVGVYFEFAEGYEFFPPSTAYGSIFFVTVGIHALHVFLGLVALGIVTLGAARGAYDDPGNSWGVEGVVKYWHFVDVAWVFIYPVLYLVS